jgi:hypothetical protein
MKKAISRSKELIPLSCDIESFINFIVNLQETLFPEGCNFSLTIYLKNNLEEKIKFDSLSEFRENQKLLPPRIQILCLCLSSYTETNGIYYHKSINFTTNKIYADSEDEQWCKNAILISGDFPIKHRVWYSFLKTDNFRFYFCMGFGLFPAIWLSIFKTSLFSIFGSKNSNTTLFLYCLIMVIFMVLHIYINLVLPSFTLRTNTQQGWTQKYREEIIFYSTFLGGAGGIVAIISLIISLFAK